MLGDTCGISSPKPTAACLSEELAVFPETLTCGHFPIVLLQLNGQREGRPLDYVHHLWTQTVILVACAAENRVHVGVCGGGDSWSASAPHLPEAGAQPHP